MKKYIASYKRTGIILLFLILTLSGCSGSNETNTEKEASQRQEETENNITEKENTEETESEEQIPKEAKQEEEIPEEAEPDTREAVVTEVNWQSCFDGINGAAVIYNPSENSYLIYNQETALTQRSPCSTFKIISSLIALEHKVIAPGQSDRKWSGEVFWNEDWNRDMDFENAFRTSCVWYYREIIDEIGKDTMQEELNKLHYGNCDISDWEGYLNTNNNNRSLTGFWIESSLKISPKEQVEVMERIFGENSDYSQETLNNLKQVMLLSEPDGQETLIYGKTGMGKSNGIVVDAWFTGFSDRTEGRVYFCVYLGETDGKDVSSAKAKEIAVEIVSNLENEK